MSHRSTAPLAAALLLLACSRGPSTGRGEGADGRLRLDRTGQAPERLLEAPARGTSCASDTTVVAVALTGDAAAVLALRTPWPPGDAATFIVERTLGGTGTAALAVRELAGDSLRAATVAIRGTVRVAAGERLNAFIEAIAEDTAGAEVPLAGRLTNVLVRRECAVAAR